MTTPGQCTCYEPMVFGIRTLIFSWSAPDSDIPLTTYRLDFTQGDIVQTIDISANDVYMSYQLSNLLPNISVEATVKASNDNGETWGPESTFPSATPIDPPPAPPSSVIATLIPDTSYVKVDWTLPDILQSGISHYIVEAIPTYGVSIQYAYISNDLYDFTYTFTELSPMEYYFTIKTENNAGRSDPIISNTIQVPFIEKAVIDN
jgi:hypothetical protein